MFYKQTSRKYRDAKAALEREKYTKMIEMQQELDKLSEEKLSKQNDTSSDQSLTATKGNGVTEEHVSK